MYQLVHLQLCLSSWWMKYEMQREQSNNAKEVPQLYKHKLKQPKPWKEIMDW